MKVLTAAQMGEVDRRTIEAGIPGAVLMENAGHRVMEFLERHYAPLASHRVVILCGKGNNGGDGMVIARQFHTRIRPAVLGVMLVGDAGELRGDAALNWRMLEACGCPVVSAIAPEWHSATLVIDAVLGTGLAGPARGPALEAIRAINKDFPVAQVVAVDIPSGMPSDSGTLEGEFVHRANATVTFTAPKISQILPPGCDHMGKLVVSPIGTPPQFYEEDSEIYLSVIERAWLRPLLQPRDPSSHKGSFGHVLVVGGSRGKSGAAAMTGIAALRSGAGLVTVATPTSALGSVAAHAPELMTVALPETITGAFTGFEQAEEAIQSAVEGKNVVAIGPGLGNEPETQALAWELAARLQQPLVIDADGLNALASASSWSAPAGVLRVLTPHPGEMARLEGISTAEVQADRVQVARSFAQRHAVVLVLKGQRTLLAFPDGEVWVNPTGTPALATGGSGDILTGMIAGMIAQFPNDVPRAIAAAVYLHGRAAELGAAVVGEKCLLATDVLRFLPAAIQDVLTKADFYAA
jgi:ADP-dependent NAD(P)H-hydrate dehydratase / NAD(P)H-hydrate epimerase